MSGLVGWIDFHRDVAAEAKRFAAMAEPRRRRAGSENRVWLGRSAGIGIRDRATDGEETVERPLAVQTDQGTAVVAFAGRLHNRGEIRAELANRGLALETRTDSQLLFQTFTLWGADCVERLNGAFTFAIWLEPARRLILGRDRLGIKPMYYFGYPGGLVFASEPKAIMSCPRFRACLDVRSLPVLLQPRLALPGETPLRGVRELPPAHLAIYGEAGLSLRRYWSLTSVPHEASFAETAQQVRSILEKISEEQVAAGAGAAFGAMLSGGIDSTAIGILSAKALRRRGERLDAYCVEFVDDAGHFVPTELRPDVDGPYAAMASASMGANHKALALTTEQLLKAVPETRRMRDLPGWGQLDASMYLLFREIGKSCDTVTTGEAADEIFGGYPYFFKPEVIEESRFPWMGDGPKLSHYLSAELVDLIRPEEDERARYSQLLATVPRLSGEDPANARMREITFLGMAGPLAVILDRLDRMSAAAGVHVSVPFCDYRIVEYVWNVPWSMKATGGVKGLLKAAMADVMPARILQRKKSAYPLVQNPLYDSCLIEEAQRIVSDPGEPVSELFDTARLRAFIEQIRSQSLPASSFPGGVSAAKMLIHLVELNVWIKDYRVNVC